MDDKEKSKKEKTVIIYRPQRVFFFECLLYCLSLGLGILAGLRMRFLIKRGELFMPPPISLSGFLFYFLFATLFFFSLVHFLRRKRKTDFFLRFLFVFSLGFGNLFFFSLWLKDILSLILVVLIFLIFSKKPYVLFHNILFVFAIAGVGAGLGLRIQPQIVLLLILIFSVYDYIAVYKTKHMVKMAKEMIEHKAILGIIIPQEFSDFFQKTNEKSFTKERFLVLGGGDIVFPLIFSVSLLSQSIYDSLLIAFFSVIGLLCGFLFFISQKTPKPIPALPSIAVFSSFAYFLTLLF